MTSVIVELVYTPRPEMVKVSLGRQMFDMNDLRVNIGALTPNDQLSLAAALVLISGHAEPRWRGWHWEARDRDGNFLGVTPPGEWYADKDTAQRAIKTLFGYGVRVVVRDGASSELLRNAYDRNAVGDAPSSSSHT